MWCNTENHKTKFNCLRKHGCCSITRCADLHYLENLKMLYFLISRQFLSISKLVLFWLKPVFFHAQFFFLYWLTDNHSLRTRLKGLPFSQKKTPVHLASLNQVCFIKHVKCTFLELQGICLENMSNQGICTQKLANFQGIC